MRLLIAVMRLPEVLLPDLCAAALTERLNCETTVSSISGDKIVVNGFAIISLVF
jgi:hypothetical protein